MTSAEADTKSTGACVPEKRQPWKEHWDALAEPNPSGSGTSHGFEKGEQVLMDGNISGDNNMGDNNDKNQGEGKKKGAAKKKGDNSDDRKMRDHGDKKKKK